jgi:hypothetical protein
MKNRSSPYFDKHFKIFLSTKEFNCNRVIEKISRYLTFDGKINNIGTVLFAFPLNIKVMLISHIVSLSAHQPSSNQLRRLYPFSIRRIHIVPSRI